MLSSLGFLHQTCGIPEFLILSFTMDFSLRNVLSWLSGTTLAFISFAGFVLALVNTSILQDDCGTGETCDNFFRRFWWTLAFQLSIMVAAFFVWIVGMHRSARVAIVGFLVLVTTQLIDLVGSHLTALDDETGWPRFRANWIDRDPLKGSLAGYLILAFANMVYMVIFGMEQDEDGTGRVAAPAETELPTKTEGTTTEAIDQSGGETTSPV